MEKKLVHKKIEEILHESLEGKLEDVVAHLIAVGARFADTYQNVTIEHEGYYDSGEFWLVGDRLETDEELQKRVLLERQRKRVKEQKELKRVEALKKELENKGYEVTLTKKDTK